jgi:hypothetical protein
MVYLFLTANTFSSNTTKIESRKKIAPTRNKFQYLNVNNFEIILKFLNLDDLPNFRRVCEKSKSNCLKQTILKLFQKFYKTKIQNSIEFLPINSSEMSHAKQTPKKFLEKIITSKTILLPKFVEHVIQTPKFRIISYIDGFFFIEEKLENQTQYSTVSAQQLFSKRFADLDSTDASFIKLLNLTFSSKHFITFILNHHNNNIFILFQAGEIFICGKTGKIRMGFHCNNLINISHFMSHDKTYLMSFLETSANFIVYHIVSGELFLFENSSNLKSILLHQNSKLGYDFFKNNGKSLGFVHAKDFLYLQMMTHIMKIKVNETSEKLNSNSVNDLLNKINKI